jgi:hypothetical protein
LTVSNIAIDLQAIKLSAMGVAMASPMAAIPSATSSWPIAAKGNGSTNLDEDTSSGVCTALNNKAS